MSPKEKAIELVEQMVSKFFNLRNGYNPGEVYYSARQCAVIAVDEILSLGYSSKSDFKVYDFYSKVKQEIEKL